MLGACATIVEGTDQTVTVITDPPDAVCTLTREGQVVAVANPTPATVSLDKSQGNISITCEKSGYFNGASALSSEFKAMTFGNIIFGGIIGVGVDAASGAMHEYPESVTVVLSPKSFSGTSDRDEFFDRQRARIEREAKLALGELDETCDQKAHDCDALAQAINDAREAELQELERQREATIVGAE